MKKDHTKKEKHQKAAKKNSSFDTIVALATPPHGSAIGVIRISGPKSLEIIFLLFKKMNGGNYFSDENEIEEKRIYHGIIADKNGVSIDEVIIHCARNPHGYTGEDSCEINCHGGPLVLKRIVDSIIEYGARMAEPGEFTRRAFLNGKMDLIRAEAIVDISNASTERARKSAFSQLKGDISPKIGEIHNKIMDLNAEVEAWIDFPEDDVDVVHLNKIKKDIENFVTIMEKASVASKLEIYLREGLDIAIIGRPNVGKSSIFNVLCNESRVIVSNIPGTTRDIISENIAICGIPVRLYDTAGIREEGDIIEKAGIDRAREILSKMDLLLLVLDSSEEINEEDIKIIEESEGLNRIILLNKNDLDKKLEYEFKESENIIEISTIDRRGFDHLEECVKDSFSNERYEGLLVTNSRHLSCLINSMDILKETINAIENNITIDIIAEGLRSSARELSEILGINYSEDLLDRIFSKFCIGK